MVFLCYPFNACGINNDDLSFISDIDKFCLYFSWSVWLEFFINYIHFSKEPTFCFMDFKNHFPFFNFMISALVFIIYLLLLNLGTDYFSLPF